MGAARTLTVCLLSSALLGATPAQSQNRFAIFAACEPEGTSTDQVVEILRAELAPAPVDRVVDPPTENDEHSAVIVVERCDEPQQSVRVALTVGGRETHQDIDLADAAPAARARTLAMAIALAIRAQIAPKEEVGEREPAPERRVESPIADRSTVDAERDARRSHSTFYANAVFRLAFDTTTPFAGIEAGGRWGRFRGGVLMLGTQRSVDLGVVRLFAATTAASFDLIPIGAIAFLARGELGVASAFGSSSGTATSSDGYAPHAALAIGFRASAPLGSSWALQTTVDGGVASSLVATSAGRDAASLGTWFASASVGVVGL